MNEIDLDTIDKQLLDLRILLYSDSLDESGALEIIREIDRLHSEYCRNEPKRVL